jgi:polyhydroxyalkanoate synthesis regulator phasin
MILISVLNKRTLPNATDIASLNGGINDLRRELATVEKELKYNQR